MHTKPRRRAFRRRGVAAALAVLCSAPAIAPASASAVFGGAPESVPGFVVAILSRATAADTDGRNVRCTGVIIDAMRVLTHSTCADTAREATWVLAGSTVNRSQAGQGQKVAVAARQKHPRTLLARNESRVAVLTLESPLTFDARTYPVALPSPGAYPAAGTVAHMAGFGHTGPATINADGLLHGLDTAIIQPLRCGGIDRAVSLCTQTPAGSACGLEFGMPLTVNGVLLGIFNSGSCGANAIDYWVNIAAPEILQFIHGNPTPPIAPRVGAPATITAPIAQAKQTATCNPATLTVAATASSFQFYATSGRLLQDSPSPTYTITSSDVGRTLGCRHIASNDGGTAIVGVANTLGPITAAPPPILGVRVTKRSKKVKRGKKITIRLSASANEPLTAPMKVCVSGPKAILKRQRCTTRNRPGVGFAYTATIKVPRTVKAGSKTFTVKVTSAGAVAASASVKVKVLR